MTTKTWAGLQSSYDADAVTLSTPDKTLTICAGPGTFHSSSEGIGTNYYSMLQVADDWEVACVSCTIGSATDMVLVFGNPTTDDSHLWFKAFNSYSVGTYSVLADVASVSGEWRYRYANGAVRATLTPVDFQKDTVFQVGVGNESRGNVTILAEHSSPGETMARDRPGVLVLESVGGTRVFLWVRSAEGVLELRCGPTDPQDDQAPPDSAVLTQW